MNKSEIDKNALELGKAILPLAGQAIVTDGATGLEKELDFVVKHAPNPAHAKLTDARRGDNIESKRLEDEVVRALHEVVTQIDYTLQNIERDAIIPGGIHLNKEEIQDLKNILQQKRDYFTQFFDETSDL
ncbi:hypothetical protein KKA95_02630 [Patescibacteria group bacterium]|nr:hypothetical protein [Patescibacteria group bacterium]